MNRIGDIAFDTWNDMKFPATLAKQGANLKPDFDYTNIGLLFPQNDNAEKIFITDQTSHSLKPRSILKPHVHWIQTTLNIAGWKMQYRFYENGTTPPSFSATQSITGSVFTYTSGTILQISRFPEIDLDALNLDGLSIFFDVIFWREDNLITGDVLMKGFDFHFQEDGMGSIQEYVKN
jgi:hypothetical protein